MKPVKVLCCMFLLAIFGLDLAQNPGKIQKVVMCAHRTNQSRHCDYLIHIYSI